jgi:hypothetical protein
MLMPYCNQTLGVRRNKHEEQLVKEKSELRITVQGDVVVAMNQNSHMELGSDDIPRFTPEIDKDLSVHAHSSARLEIVSHTDAPHVRKLPAAGRFRLHVDGQDLEHVAFLGAFEAEQPSPPAAQVCAAELGKVSFELPCKFRAKERLQGCLECLLECLEATGEAWSETTPCLSGLSNVLRAPEDGQTGILQGVLCEREPLQYEDGMPVCPRRKQHVLHVMSIVGTPQGQRALAEYMQGDAMHDEDEWTACMLNLMVDLHMVRDPIPALFEEVRHHAYPDAAHARDVGTRRAREESPLAPPAVLVLGSLGRNSARGSHPELQLDVGSLLTLQLEGLLATDEKYKCDREKFERMALKEYEAMMPHMQLRYLQHTLNLHGMEFYEAWEVSAEEEKDLWRNQTLTWMADQVRAACALVRSLRKRALSLRLQAQRCLSIFYIGHFAASCMRV